MAKGAPKRAVGYVRVSTTIQAEEGVSLDAQRGRIVGWCEGRGIPFDPADLFTDAGVSGKRADNRPGLRAALDAVCGCGGVLVVYSLSRLARSVRDTLAIAEQLERAGADLVSLSEDINTTSAAGKMLFRLLAVLAEFERDLISERTRGAQSHKRARGEAIGHAPYGSRIGPDGRTLIPDPAEVANLDAMRRWRAEGWSDRAIARELQSRGVPTKRGGPWTHPVVGKLLKTPIRIHVPREAS